MLKNSVDYFQELIFKFKIFKNFGNLIDLGYSLFEDERRFHIFQNNLLSIVKHNSLRNQTYLMKLNNMAHLTEKEFQEFYLTRLPQDWSFLQDWSKLNMEPPSIHLDSESKVPDSFDWRTQGYVSPPKHQQSCGSCYAFGAVIKIDKII